MPKCGLVLGGGGARGAYEVGILSYLFLDGPAELREMARFNVLCGTSIGAINAAATAATIHQPAVGIRKLRDLWTGLTLDSILEMHSRDLLTLPSWMLGRTKRASLFSGDPIRRLIEKAVDWEQIHVNLAEGHLEAVTISCTRVTTGKTVVFYETGDGRQRRFSADPHVKPVYARLSADHAMGSAAIPFVFPPVPIDGIPYADGGLRQNTPLSPALRLGCDSLLVIGLGSEKSLEPDDDLSMYEVRKASSPVFLLAKVTNALMLDHVDYDLIRLENINRLLEDGEAVFGSEFTDRLNATVSPIRGAKYRVIPSVVLRPSRDLGHMAADYVRGNKLGGRGMAKRAIRMLARMESRKEADLTSYILFDGGYCEQLINLGMEDAAAKKDDLMRMFGG